MKHRKFSRQKGVSLIEVLIALVVLGIGVLGLAYLQTWGTRFSQESYYRSQATTIAYELMERMRLNAAISRANIDINDYTTSPSNDPQTVCETSITDGIASPVIDKECFYSKLQNFLPSGNATITSVDTAEATISVQIEVAWNDRNIVVADPDSNAAKPCALPRKASSEFSWTHSDDPGAGTCMQVQNWVVEL